MMLVGVAASLPDLCNCARVAASFDQQHGLRELSKAA